MDWKKLTLSQIRRLVAAIEQASDGREVVPTIIERATDEPMPHGRVTMESLINLLEQLGGCTVLSAEVLAAIKQLNEPPPAGAPEVATVVDGNGESELTAPFNVFVNGDITLAGLVRAGAYKIEPDDEECLFQCLGEERSANQEMVLVHFINGTSSGWAMLNIDLQRPGWRVATARELLAFGVAYPDQQVKYPVVALGTEIIKDGNRTVLALGCDNGKPAHLVSWDGNWNSICRFLVVKKAVVQPTNEEIFDSLVAACRFADVNKKFTAKNFPLVDDHTTGRIDEMLLRGMDIDEALAEIRRRGYRPVGVRRGLEYIAANRLSLQANPRRIVIAAGDRWLGHSPVFTIQGALVMHVTSEPYAGGSCYLVARPA